MRRVVITDTSILIIFRKLDSFNLLREVYGSLYTTPEVQEEFGEDLPEWIIVREVAEKKYQRFLESQIDSGEASAIALAAELVDPLLLLDDLKARKLALRLNFKVTGTFGVIKKAKDLNVISEARPLISKLLETDFRVATHIIEEFYKICGE
jgi:predicted nucleic acid-binding protein